MLISLQFQKISGTDGGIVKTGRGLSADRTRNQNRTHFKLTVSKWSSVDRVGELQVSPLSPSIGTLCPASQTPLLAMHADFTADLLAGLWSGGARSESEPHPLGNKSEFPPALRESQHLGIRLARIDERFKPSPVQPPESGDLPCIWVQRICGSMLRPNVKTVKLGNECKVGALRPENRKSTRIN